MVKSCVLPVVCAGVAVGLMSVGCKPRDEISTYSAPKEPTVEQKPVVQAAMTPEPMAPNASDAPAQAASPVQWTVPAGWATRQPGAMQFAAFEPVPGDAEVLVTVVPMPAGQPTLPNLNRWEGQVGLPPSSQAEADAKVVSFDVAGVPMKRVKVVGTGKDGAPAAAIDAVFVDRGDQEWFFKLTGRAEKVAAQQAKFDEFIQSLRFGAGTASSVAPATPSPTPSVPKGVAFRPSAPADMAAAPAGAKPNANAGLWDVPATWVAQEARPMRIASWQTAANGDSAEVIISQFAVGGFGTMEANINRWRGMVGLPPITNISEAPPAKIKVGDTEAQAFDFVGTDADPIRVCVVLVPTQAGDRLTFFRLQGSAASVAQAKADFDKLIQTARVP